MKELSAQDPFAPEVLACPHEYNQQLREQAPVYHCPKTGIYFVSNYDLVMDIAKNDSVFSSKFANLMTSFNDKEPTDEEKKQREELNAIRRKGFPRIDTMLTQDLPEQRRYRSLCQKPFSVKNVAKLRPYLTELSNELIDQFIDDRECDWMKSFCVPIAVKVIAKILGVPFKDMDLFKKWSDANVHAFAAGQTHTELMHSSQLVVDFQHYFAQKIEDRQRQPTDDVLSEIVNSTADGERPMNVPECLSVIAQLLVAGNETTTATFAEGMSLLINNPDQLEKVQKNRKLIPNMVEEMLRLATPSAQMWRIVTQDTNIGGVDIPKGSTIMIKWISANRDEQFYPDGHRFDVERHNSRRHLAFGQGIHHCPGAPLARLELEVGWEVILDRMTNFSTDTELEFHPSLLLHAPVGIHIKFNKT